MQENSPSSNALFGNPTAEKVKWSMSQNIEQFQPFDAIPLPYIHKATSVAKMIVTGIIDKDQHCI